METNSVRQQGPLSWQLEIVSYRMRVRAPRAAELKRVALKLGVWRVCGARATELKRLALKLGGLYRLLLCRRHTEGELRVQLRGSITPSAACHGTAKVSLFPEMCRAPRAHVRGAIRAFFQCPQATNAASVHNVPLIGSAKGSPRET
jgi:hypothetical protein